jgi:hypothetical protein
MNYCRIAARPRTDKGKINEENTEFHTPIKHYKVEMKQELQSKYIHCNTNMMMMMIMI